MLNLTCETGARWSGALGNQMCVKGWVIEMILYGYLNLKVEIRVCRLHRLWLLYYYYSSLRAPKLPLCMPTFGHSHSSFRTHTLLTDNRDLYASISQNTATHMPTKAKLIPMKHPPLLLHPGLCAQRDDIYRVHVSLKAGQKNFTVPVPA